MNKNDLRLLGTPLLIAMTIQWFLWIIHVMHFNNNYDLFGTTFVLWFGLLVAYIVGAAHDR